MEINNEAIHENADVSAEDLIPVETVEGKEPKEELNLSPRDVKLREIAARREAEYAENSGEAPSYKANLADEQEAEEAADPKELKPSPVYMNGDGEYVMKLKINGQEVEQRVDHVVATAQKHESADQRLQALHDQQRSLEEQRRRQEEYDRQLQAERLRLEEVGKRFSAPSGQDVGKEGLSVDDIDAILDEAAESLFDGDKSKFVEKLKPLLKGRENDATLNVEELIQRARDETIRDIDQREQAKARQSAEADYQKSIRQGVEWLEKTYPIIDDSRRLRDLVDLETETIQATEPNLTPFEMIQKATETVVKKVGLKQPTDKAPSDRLENKSQMRLPPLRQGSSPYTPPVEEVVDNSPKAVIARQREQREMLAGRR